MLGMTPGSPIAPPLLSGHGLRAPDEVVLGAATLAALHKQVGDWVTVTDGGTAPFRLRIAGTATLPSLGVQQTLHTEMGTGAVLDYQHIPGDTAAEPNEILVTLRPGADLAAAQARLQRIVPIQNGGVIGGGFQRPAEITDYRSMGVAPLILAGALAAGAVASLWLTLAASVRRRRADLALLEDARPDQAPARRDGRLAVDRRRGGGRARRRPPRHRARPLPVGPVRPPDQRRPRTVGPRASRSSWWYSAPWRRRTWSRRSPAAPPPASRPPPCCARE